MEFNAKVLYDFTGESESEVSLREGDVVTVLNTEVPGGWWYGRSNDGVEGMFPSAYVEALPSHQPAAPPVQPAAPPVQQAAQPVQQNIGWGLPPPPTAAEGRVHTTSGSSWGDEWNSTDEDSTSSTVPQPAQVPVQPMHIVQYSTVNKPTTQSTDTHQKVGEKKSFSLAKIPFGKSGGGFDAYLSGAMETSATTQAEAVTILDNGAGYFYWSPSPTSYTCTIGVPKKGAKFGGFKAYMTYPVTPSFNNIQVSRRYKHFDWLHDRLTEKYGAVIAIPPLPDKQVTGRFEEELIENRRIELQSFTDRICRHPVLSQSAVWRHFITETDERKWTAGKRKAESDPLVGPAFLTTIQTSEADGNDDEISDFNVTLGKVENSVKNAFNVMQDQSNRCRTVLKKDVQQVGTTLVNLGISLNSQIPALEQIGDSFQKLGDVHETQATRCWDHLVHLLHDYRGLTNSWGDVINSYTSAKDRQRDEFEGGSNDKERLASRARISTYRLAVLAEKNLFLEEAKADFDHAAQTFVYEQMNHYREMLSRLETLYSTCWSGDSASATVAATAAPVNPPASVVPPANTAFSLDPWNNEESIYEEMP